MKDVEVCLRAREVRESCLHRCDGTVRLVQACSCAGNA